VGNGHAHQHDGKPFAWTLVQAMAGGEEKEMKKKRKEKKRISHTKSFFAFPRVCPSTERTTEKT
jgi:hypothetical protein